MKTKIIKQIAIVLCFLMFTPLLVQGQEIDNSYNKLPHELNYMYLKKNKKQKTAAWILLGSGVALFTGGFILAKTEEEGMDWGVPSAGASSLLIIGSLSTLVSIPFFISAESNKRKAELALKKETVSIGVFEKTNNYSLSLTIPF